MAEFTILTAAGRGAISCVSIGGDDAAIVLGTCAVLLAGGNPGTLKCGQIRLARWISTGEELVVCRRRDDQFEVHCHGGRAAVCAVAGDLAARGALEMPGRDWLARTCQNTIQAEAAFELTRATTHLAVDVLLAQWHGALAKGVRGMLEATEDVAPSTHDDKQRRRQELIDGLANLLQLAPAGVHLTRPFAVVVAGRPNVGKSSLVNALAGFARSIVLDIPGTTRDLVTVSIGLDGWPVELVDTAGLHAGGDDVEQEGIRRARVALAGADLRVLVLDRSLPLTPEDSQLLADWPAALVTWSKCDLPSAPENRPPEAGEILASAVTGQGMDRLAAAIISRLVPRPLVAGEPVPFTTRQSSLLKSAHVAALECDWRLVADLLSRLLHEPLLPDADHDLVPATHRED